MTDKPKTMEKISLGEEGNEKDAVYGPKTNRELPEAFKAHIGKGRPKGVPNKVKKRVSEMLEIALERAGAEDYFFRMMTEGTASDRQAVIALIGRLMPTQIQAQMTAQIQHVVLPWMKTRGIGKVQAEDMQSLASVGKSLTNQQVVEGEVVYQENGRQMVDPAGTHGADHD